MNMERSFTSAASERSDLRELIPEIYFLPDLFENNNKLCQKSFQNAKKKKVKIELMLIRHL